LLILVNGQSFRSAPAAVAAALRTAVIRSSASDGAALSVGSMNEFFGEQRELFFVRKREIGERHLRDERQRNTLPDSVQPLRSRLHR
jgi:hypothetical protein